MSAGAEDDLSTNGNSAMANEHAIAVTNAQRERDAFVQSPDLFEWHAAFT